MSSQSKTHLKLSIVVAASVDASSLKECLKSLTHQTQSPDTEVIVVSNYDDGIQGLIEKEFPFVKYLSLPKDTTVPALRSKGIALSGGEIVALIEDHCLLDKNWCSEIKRAHNSPYAIVGGSVENVASSRLLDWAVYFYEYGKYMLPNKIGAVDTLPGNNISYKKSALERLAKSFKDGFFETFINQELSDKGYSLYFIPSAIVYHNRTYRLGKATIQCFHHGRSFAGMRISNSTIFERTVLVLGSTTLPILLPLRIALRIMRKAKHRKELSLSLPYLFILMTSWSCGELCGYLCGEGNSSKKWT